MRYRESLPDINRLSIVSAVIMLAFALTRLVSFPAQDISFLLFGILVEFTFDFSTLITVPDGDTGSGRHGMAAAVTPAPVGA